MEFTYNELLAIIHGTGTLKVNERKAGPEIPGVAKWNRRSRGQGRLRKI
jgi:hypothetical protein